MSGPASVFFTGSKILIHCPCRRFLIFQSIYPEFQYLTRTKENNKSEREKCLALEEVVRGMPSRKETAGDERVRGITRGVTIRRGGCSLIN